MGGYYDAGDNVKFGWPMAFAVTLLSWTAVEYEKEMASVMQLEHLRSSIRWGTDFILRAHVSPTTLYTQVCRINSILLSYLLSLFRHSYTYTWCPFQDFHACFQVSTLPLCLKKKSFYLLVVGNATKVLY